MKIAPFPLHITARDYNTKLALVTSLFTARLHNHLSQLVQSASRSIHPSIPSSLSATYYCLQKKYTSLFMYPVTHLIVVI